MYLGFTFQCIYIFSRSSICPKLKDDLGVTVTGEADRAGRLAGIPKVEIIAESSNSDALTGSGRIVMGDSHRPG